MRSNRCQYREEGKKAWEEGGRDDEREGRGVSQGARGAVTDSFFLSLSFLGGEHPSRDGRRCQREGRWMPEEGRQKGEEGIKAGKKERQEGMKEGKRGVASQNKKECQKR